MAVKGKSGLKKFDSGEVIFNDGDHAESLYIIQKGQMRLYKPKGKGFIEIAVLRAGEVIGEMAYFDDDGSGRRRSCAASAMVATDVIEISFAAFEKTMEALNPWFKTIINTLASRLRKSNSRIKELEANSVSHSYGGKTGTYTFFKSADIVKALSTLFLVFKGHGEPLEKGMVVHKNTLGFYATDVFNIMESKFDFLLSILVEQNFLSFREDKDGNAKNIYAPDINTLRSILIFINSQRIAPDDKKIIISVKCENFLNKILEECATHPPGTDAVECSITEILEGYKMRHEHIDLPDLEDAKSAKFVGEVIIGEGNSLSIEVQLEKLRSLMPSIRLVNAVNKFNETQSN